jgi:hypothetical protein
MGMTRTAGLLFACALALISTQASAQVGASAPSAGPPEVDQTAVPSDPQRPTANPPTADDVCRTLEEAAAENGLPVEFFARVIWQESRFNARAVSPKGASGIAQFMPQTAGWHGLADPFDPIEAASFGGLSARIARSVWQSRARCGGLQCGSRPSKRVANKPSLFARRGAQLRGNHHRLDRGRMGIRVTSTDGGYHHSPGRTLHSACQSHPGSERGGKTHRDLHTALGNMACSPFGGEQGMGDVS